MEHISATFFIVPDIFLAVSPSAAIVLCIVLALLFVISFFASGSETAFFSLHSKDLNMLKTRPQPAYKRIVSLLEQPKTLMASILITNSFVNIGIVVILNTLLDNVFLATNLAFWPIFFIKILIITLALVLFVEITPKLWATHHKIWFASTASLMIEIFHSVFYSFSKRMMRLNDRVENSLTSESAETMDDNSLDDAIDMLPDSEATMEEKKILKGIRKFADTEVKQIMRTRMDVSGIEYSLDFKAVMAELATLHYSRLPVYKNNLDEPAGMLHTKDLIPHLDEDADFEWHTLIREPYYVHEQKFIEDLMREFLARRNHFAIVVDEFGGTSGIVTLEDIMEEIIGEIEDEFDVEESINKKIDDYNFIFEGKMMIGDACKAMAIPKETFDNVRGDSDSIAGLVLEIAGDFPDENSAVVSGDFTFVPLSISKNRIESIKVTIRPKVQTL